METFQQRYDAMVRAIARYTPYVNMQLINQAVDYAANKHANQVRKDGSPYIIHPLAVSEIVAEIGLDTDSLVAALLHDCIEDTDSTHDDLSRLFGEKLAGYADAGYLTWDGDTVTLTQDGVFFGKVQNVRALISYEGGTLRELTADFCAAIEDYETLCIEQEAE